MKTNLAFNILVTILAVGQANAQDENSRRVSGADAKYTLFNAGVEAATTSYIDTDTKDSNGVKLYLAPYLDYNHKTGLGIRVKTYALTGGSNPGFYLSSATAYFAQYTGKIYPFVSYTRYIQHDNASVPYSPIQNEVYAHVRIKTKVVDPKAGIDIGFGQDEQNDNEKVSDVNAFVGLSRLFPWYNLGKGGNSALGIVPSIQVNAGTDRYYKFLRTARYISRSSQIASGGYGRGGGRMGNGNGDGNTGTSGVTEYIISEQNDFGLSNLELNLYVIYFLGKFSFEPSAGLYFPIRGDDKTPYGYLQFNLNYWIK